MIIALTGLKRSGKNTTSSYIAERYKFVEYAFANPIKEACCLLFDWTLDYIELFKEVVDERWGITPRQALQWLGTEAFQYSLPNTFTGFKKTVDRGFWVKKFIYFMEQNPDKDFVISDFRFPHEADVLKQYDTRTIKVLNPNICNTDLHESEQYIESLECDYTLLNNGTKEHLYTQIDDVVNYILRYE